MDKITAMILTILEHEGGFVDDPADAGGATKHGISLRYARGIGLDLDGDGDTDKDDIRLVTKETAAELYREDFYIRPRLYVLPEPVQPVVFDSAVNHGPPRAIIFVQRVLIQAGFLPAIINGREQDDGVMGPKTRRAAEAAQAEMGPYFVNAIVYERLAFYDAIVRRDPSQARFLRGWRRRARSFLLPTAAWSPV